jgi:hypothetical protein
MPLKCHHCLIHTAISMAHDERGAAVGQHQSLLVLSLLISLLLLSLDIQCVNQASFLCIAYVVLAEWTMIGAQSNPWSWIDPGAFALVGAGQLIHSRRSSCRSSRARDVAGRHAAAHRP